MAKTLILGANGGVGRKLVQLMKENNEDFVAGVRQNEQKEALQSDGIQAEIVDVEKQSIEDLQHIFNDFDQVIFSVGSGGSTGADKTIIVDLDGAVKAIRASEKANIEHFVMVSTYDSRREAFDAVPDLKPYTIAKHYVDDYLRHSSLTATIVHPGGLTDNEGTGKVVVAELFENPDKREIPREDVARVLYEVATDSAHRGKEFQVLTGDTDVAEALKSFK
ncbi:SDR family oxidoreductase [Staphylococcus canis]|uniref:SDR family oxidoreductase n=1 Tax=Staphylococcus canis TaxID=2724942 RepID=A0ABS0T6H3_9STAP|nr:SDR family oxidoreductase [Staphylococcus canis]MBI5974355.1 SDR family oxidoreductase [Staphylococcus canis]